MAGCYVEAIQNVQTEGRFLLGGYSFGAHVAFEMALQLQRRGKRVDRLVILDDAAPSRDPLGAMQVSETELIARAVDLVGRLSGSEAKLDVKAFEGLSERERLAYLRQHLERSGVLVPGSGDEMVGGLINVLRATVRMRYVPQGNHEGDIILFRTQEDRPEDPGLVQASGSTQDPTWGWQRLCTGTVQVHWVPGDHSTMLMEPHVAVLARSLDTYLQHASDRIAQLAAVER
jgi:thioesterase domain-containing protein